MSLLSGPRIGSEKYPALTGIRAAGATVVFFDHFPLWADSHITINVMAFFFALSGFLIVRIYYEQVELSGRWLTKYFVNRFARIYPVYFLLLTVTVCLQHETGAWNLLRNYTLTHALFHGADVIIQPSWSLTAEECFYLLAPLFMVLSRKYHFLAPLALGCGLFGAALFVSTLGFAFLGTPGFVLSTTFFGHFLEFFAGAWLALALMTVEKKEPLRIPGSRYTMSGFAGVSLLAIAMILVYRQVPLHAGAVILINNFLIPLPIALLYWGLLREDTFLSRFLSSRTLGLLGRSSYAFYLLHSLTINFIAVPFLLPLVGYRPACVVLTFAVTWLISIGLFLFYEEPVNIFVRTRFHTRERWVGAQGTLFR